MQEGKSKLIEAVKALRQEIYGKVQGQLADEGKTYQQIADAIGVSLATVQRIAQRDGITRPVGPRPQSSVSEVSNGD